MKETPTITRETVLTVDELAKALKVNRRIAERMDLPFFMAGKRQRFVWGQVLDVLAERARTAA